MASFQRPHALREGTRVGRVTNVELFFDLVYVFAVTQLSELLVRHATGAGVFQAAILLAMVWQVWAYTTWTLNYLDPDRTPVRGMLVALMLGSLVLAAALPEAFQQHGLLVAVVYAAMQIGRSVFTLWELRGEQLQLVYRRLLPWTLVSGAVAVAGGLCGGHVREALWIVSIAIDVIGARAGFWVPWIGGSATTEWTINGGHFAERCQAFVLIALGESIVVIGAELRLDRPGLHDILAFGAAFLGAVGLWWVYFDRTADDSVRQIDESHDPGRLARSAFHWVHPLIIAGIILTAAADERVLAAPAAPGSTPTAWLILGGTALFLAGHALFKGLIWHVVSWPRVAGAVVLLALGVLAPHTAVLTLGICALAVIVAVAVADRMSYRG
jgi:low temperature requirement protein LtrA